MNKSGFTLIELLVVVLIIGILSAVALPQYQIAVQKTRSISLLPLLRSISDAENIYLAANGRYTLNFDELDLDMPAGGTLTMQNNLSKITYKDFECYIRTAGINIPADYSAYCNNLKKSAPRLEKYFSEGHFICWGENGIKKRTCQSITGKPSTGSAHYFK